MALKLNCATNQNRFIWLLIKKVKKIKSLLFDPVTVRFSAVPLLLNFCQQNLSNPDECPSLPPRVILIASRRPSSDATRDPASEPTSEPTSDPATDPASNPTSAQLKKSFKFV